MFKKRKKTIFYIIMIIIFIFFYSFNNSKKEIMDVQLINHVSIVDKNDEIIYEQLYNKEGSFVNIENIPKDFINFVINIEDRNFYKHHGFDLYRIGVVSFTNFFRKNKHGASTITQQYVKNLYLSNKKSYSRKLIELWYSTRLEKIYSKEDILEGYFNTIYFGNNIYGINDACMFYFNKTPLEININEMALLIVLIKAPNGYSPTNDYIKSMNKKDEILKLLYSKNLISLNVFNNYYKKDIFIHQKPIQKYSSSVMYFKDVVLEELENLKVRPKFNENIVIHTNYEKTVNEELEKQINSLENNDDVSCVILDKNGFYVSLIGGKNYYDYSYNIALNGNRDIGSTIKPLLYYEALKDGFTPLTTFHSGKSTFNIDGDNYDVSNYNDVYENSPITLGYALATSDNIYAVKSHLYLGMDKLSNLMNKFNVKSTPTPTLALGNTSTSLKNLTSIYLTLSNLGLYNEPRAITHVTNNKNELLYKKKSLPIRKLQRSTTYVLNNLMTLMFDNNISNKLKVTGSGISDTINVKTAGKSGLTDYDSYMVGFNNDYCVGIWSGHVNNELLLDPNLKSLPKQLYANAFNCLEKQNNIYYHTPKEIIYKNVNPTLFNKSYRKSLPFLR